MHRSPELGGVAIEAVMRLSHVDRPPLGDVVQTVAVMAATNPQATLSLEVGAGADTCLAQGAELAAGGPATRALRGHPGDHRRAPGARPAPPTTQAATAGQRPQRLRQWTTLWTCDSSKGAWDD